MDPLKAAHNQTVFSSALSLCHIRGAQGRQMQPQGNMDTYRVHRAVSGKCRPFADLGCCYLPSPVQSRDISRPQENQPEEHIYHIPLPTPLEWMDRKMGAGGAKSLPL